MTAPALPPELREALFEALGRRSDSAFRDALAALAAAVPAYEARLRAEWEAEREPAPEAAS